MKKVDFPLGLRMKGAEAANLHEALLAAGLQVDPSEKQGQVFGKSTFRAVQQFQKRARIPLTGQVDEKTAQALSRILRAKGLLSEEPLFRVSGKVKNRSGEPVSGKTVCLFEVDFRGADLFQKADTLSRLAAGAGLNQAGTARSGPQGEYEIYFDPQLSEGGLAGVGACVVDQGSVSGRSSVATKRDLAEGMELRGLDVLLAKSSERTQSEFSLLMEKVTPLLGSARLALRQLNQEQVRLFSEETRQPVERVNLLAAADRLRADYPEEDLPLELLYGMGRQSLLLNWPALAMGKGKDLEQAVRTSLRENVIPPQKQELVEAFLVRLAGIASTHAAEKGGEPEEEAMGKTLKTALGDGKRAADFLKLYRNFAGTPEEFWKTHLPKQPPFRDDPQAIRSLQLTNQLAILTGNHPPLMEEIQVRRKVREARDLLGLKREEWLEILKRTGVPEGISGSTDPEKATRYVAAIEGLLHAAYPTETVARMIQNGSIRFAAADSGEKLKAFFSKADGFQIGSSRIDGYSSLLKEISGGKVKQVKADLQRLQRVYQISPTPEAMATLLAAGFSSAYQVARMPEQAFLSAQCQALGDAGARAVYQRASYQAARAQQVALVLNEVLSGATPQAAPHWTNRKEIEEVVGKYIPNWQELFGRADLCECKHCRSVYSPAAYLVDLLQFLRASSANGLGLSPLDILIGNAARGVSGRRPDLAELALTCENTNTVIPYIDLVNEVMEYYVSRGKLDGDAARDTGDATPEELRANPQNTLKSAYVKLSDAVYPFNLPYHQPLDVIRTNLHHLKTSRAELMEELRTLWSSRAARSIQAEGLHLSEEEYKLLTGKDFSDRSTPRGIWECYGFASFTQLRGEGLKVPEFLKRTGITYKELVELVDTRLINPGRADFEFVENLFAGSVLSGKDVYDRLKRIKAGTLLPQNDPEVRRVLEEKGIAGAEFASWVSSRFSSIQAVITLYEPESRCDLETTLLRSVKAIHEELAEDDIAAGVFNSIHRLLRLRRKLGWTIPELDTVMAALGEAEIGVSAVEKLSAVRKILERVKIKPAELACLWGAIDTHGSSSLYFKLFLNKAVQRIDAIFQPDPLGRILPDRGQLLKDHLAAVLAPLRLTGDQVRGIARDAGVDFESAPLSLGTLSILYRYAALAAALQVSVADLCTLRGLFGGSPFSRWNASQDRFEEPLPLQALHFIERVQEVKESGFGVPVLQSVLNGALPSPAAPVLEEEKVRQAIRSTREGLFRVEQEHPEDEPVTPELIEKKISIVFHQGVAREWIGLLKGDVLLSTPAEANLDLVIPPELREKIGYGKATGRLQCQGILTASEKDTLEHLPGATPGFRAAVRRLYDKPGQFIQDHFGALFPETAGAPDALRVPDPARFAENLALFYSAYLPFLKGRLRRQVLAQSVAAALGMDEPAAEVLIKNQMDAILTELSRAGLSVSYYKDRELNEIGYRGVEKEINFSWGDQAPCEGVPADRFSACWEAWVSPPATGEYTLTADVTAADECVTVWVDGQKLFEKAPGSSVLSCEGICPLQSGTMHRLKVTYVEGTGQAGVRLYWNTDILPKEIVPAQAFSPTTVVERFTERLRRFHRAALAVKGFGLDLKELIHFTDRREDFGGLDFTGMTAAHWKRLYDYTRLRKEVPQLVGTLLQIFETANRRDPEPSLSQLRDLIVLATHWNPDELDRLIAAFNLRPADFRNEIPLLRLQNAIRLIARTGMPADLLLQWAHPQADFDQLDHIAQSVKNAVKARYEDGAWLQVSKGLSDTLRENQKAALIGFLMQKKELQQWGVSDADGLFEYFLIDVQMGAKMDTSRIKQAISSVQLFVARCLMNLESETNSAGRQIGVSPGQIDKNRWEWMKNYRVWEANRKVFLFPENWLEPELRDDKSPFFQELESEVLQNDIIDPAVEKGFRSYLEKLSEVSNLDLCGMAQDDNTRTLHVFGRSHAKPYQYYYRARNPYGRWSAWEKVPLDIRGMDDDELLGEKSGVHLIPVVWKSRLLLFWPEFMEKQQEAQPSGNLKTIAEEEGVDDIRPVKYWEMKLAWGEYRDGRWSPKQLSGEFLTTKSFPFTHPRNLSIRAEQTADELKVRIHGSEREGGFVQSYSGVFTLPEIRSRIGVWHSIAHYYSPSTPAPAYSNFYTAREKEGKLRLAGTDYLLNGRYHRLLYDRQFADPEPTLKYPFFYQDEFRPFFVSVGAVENLSLMISSPDQAPFVPIEKVRKKYLRMETAGLEAVIAGPLRVPDRAFNAGTGRLRRALPTTPADAPRISKVRKNGMAPVTEVTRPFGAGVAGEGLYTGIFEFFTVSGPRFQSFYHPYAAEFITRLNRYGIPGLLEADRLPDDEGDFFEEYEPAAVIPRSSYPRKNVDFGSYRDGVYEYGPYSLYNWELFFHAPLFIATKLSRNGKYAEAMKWYHYLFDPTTDEKPSPENPNARYWKVKPFRAETPEKGLEDFFLTLQPGRENPLVTEWRDNPFQPHRIARGRPLAYMKHVVMRYLDNLIAWGDDLFRRDTIESINEATQIYVMAAHILGPRPQSVPERGSIQPETYRSLQPKLDSFSNALVQLENLFPFSGEITESEGPLDGSLLGVGQALYFCIPRNEQLLSYWDTVTERLFKIRHCMTLQGVERKLDLFEPPIEPGLLIQAAAKGIALGEVLNELNSPAPFYRFTVMLQKACEFCAEVKSLGASLLAAEEKKDAETLARIRAAHESSLLGTILGIKERQLLEARANRQALEKSRETAEKRREYYRDLLGGEAGESLPAIPELPEPIGAESELPADTLIPDLEPDVDVTLMDADERGVKLIPKEREELSKSEDAKVSQSAAAAMEGFSGIMHLMPNFQVAVEPFGVGTDTIYGGQHLGAAVSALAKIPQIIGIVRSHEAAAAAKVASYIRREQEWTYQANMAAREIIQLDKQLIAAEIRIQMARKELEHHRQQTEQAGQIDLFLKGDTLEGYGRKLTTLERYQWMKEQLYAVYRESYQLAYDMAKKAEKAYRFELGQPEAAFIQHGYWEGMVEGLTAGERLSHALKQMEKAYVEENRRELELTKHVSLGTQDPLALMELKQTGSCTLTLPEELFDLDYPGHYFRRIKSVSISIPCITGPYTTVNTTLRLLNNSIRINASTGDGGYARKNEEGVAVEDSAVCRAGRSLYRDRDQFGPERQRGIRVELPG